MGPSSNLFFQLVLISLVVTLISCLIWQIISCILPLNEYGYVYAWIMLGSGPAINLQKMLILAKILSFPMKLILILAGMLTSKIIVFWGTENPHTYIEKPTHLKRVTVWCGYWSRGIIGQFFFENEQGEAVTVNGEHYRAMLNEFLFTKIEEEDIGNIWFQQNGATCHTAEATLDVLRPVFKDCIISRRANVAWPPRSCDLTPLDYYLWGGVKDKCYADKPETIDALKDTIRETIG